MDSEGMCSGTRERKSLLAERWPRSCGLVHLIEYQNLHSSCMIITFLISQQRFVTQEMTSVNHSAIMMGNIAAKD